MVSAVKGSVKKTYSLTDLSVEDMKEIIGSLSERSTGNGDQLTRDKLIAEIHTTLALGGDFIPRRSSHKHERNGETGHCPE